MVIVCSLHVWIVTSHQCHPWEGRQKPVCLRRANKEPLKKHPLRWLCPGFSPSLSVNGVSLLPSLGFLPAGHRPVIACIPFPAWHCDGHVHPTAWHWSPSPCSPAAALCAQASSPRPKRWACRRRHTVREGLPRSLWQVTEFTWWPMVPLIFLLLIHTSSCFFPRIKKLSFFELKKKKTNWKEQSDNCAVTNFEEIVTAFSRQQENSWKCNTSNFQTHVFAIEAVI